MSRYNTNAGLKGAAPPELPTGDNEKAPLPRWVLPLIVIGASLVVITLLVLSVAVCAVSQQEGATSDEPTTTQSETTALDYNELFAEEETTSEHENVFIKKDTSNSQAPSPQRQTQPSTKATTQTPRNNQSSASNNSNSNSSNNSSGGSNSGGNSTSGGSSGGNSGGGNSGGSSGGNSGGGSSGGNSGGGNSGGSGSSSSSGGGSSSKQSVNPPQPAQPAQPAKPSTIAVTGVSISNSSLTLYVGETANLSASVSPSNATNKSITWASGNSSVASVSQGTVKANKEGTTTIYAASNNGIKAGCAVTVKKKPEEPKARLIPSEVNMYVGEQYVISLMGATDAEWESSNPFVVKLIPGIHNCYITGEKAGVTNIIATLSNGEKIKCKVTVKA